MEKPKDAVFSTCVLFLGIQLNNNMIGHIWEKYSLGISIVNSFIGCIFLILRIYGRDYLIPNAKVIIMNMSMIIIVIPLWQYTNIGLENIQKKKASMVGKI
jgi:hypothetical protein